MEKFTSKINVIIAASGVSSRYGKNKLFEKCASSIVLIESIKPFLERTDVTRVVVAINSSFSDEFFNALSKYGLDEDTRIKVTHGADTRTGTIKSALVSVEDDCSIVLVHDGARPFVSPRIIDDVAKGVREVGAAIPVVQLIDAMCLVNDDGTPTPVDRRFYRGIQTPQGFDKDALVDAYAHTDGKFNDDFSLFVKHFPNAAVKVVDGEPDNRKITLPSDLNRHLSGVGYDIHRLQEHSDPNLKSNDYITLCGVKIPNSKHLVAHSDGDVPVHALMDAMLTAVGEPDIGHLFPVKDARYDGVFSMSLLKKVCEIVAAKGYYPTSVSISLICEEPHLAPYLSSMKDSLGATLHLNSNSIGIAVTTNETVGEIGQNQAIAAFASVMLKRI